MTPRRRPTLWLAFAALAAGAGCDETTGPAPPQIRFGEDVCVQCSMIISDERYAAGASLLVDGRHESRAFDDIGCLLAYRAAHEQEIQAEYVRDFRTRQWLEVAGAVYVHSPSLHSPMAFGVAACADRAGAEALQADAGGEVLDAAALAARYDRGELRIDPTTTRKEDDG